MAEMAGKLKNATDRCEFLEKEHRVEQEDLKKATAEAKDARSAMRAIKEELRQAGDIATGKPLVRGYAASKPLVYLCRTRLTVSGV